MNDASLSIVQQAQKVPGESDARQFSAVLKAVPLRAPVHRLDDVDKSLSRAVEERDRAVEERDAIANDFDTLVGEYRRLAAEKDAIAAARNRSLAEGESVRRERDGWIVAHGEAIAERDHIARAYENLLATRVSAIASGGRPRSTEAPIAPLPLKMATSADAARVLPPQRSRGVVARVLGSFGRRAASADAVTEVAASGSDGVIPDEAHQPPGYVKRVRLTGRVSGSDQRSPAAREAEFLSALREPAVVRAAVMIAEEIATYQAYRRTADYTAVYARPAPLVSVCIAAQDQSELLIDRALNSVLAQSYRNLQVVVVGNCCSDEIGRRLASLQDSRVTFVKLSEPCPCSAEESERRLVADSCAVNQALSLAAGDFVTHLSECDEMLPHRIETLVGAALATRADFLWHPLWLPRGDGTWTRSASANAPPCAGAILYHRFFARYAWDSLAYFTRESSYANWLRKVSLLRPQAKYIDDTLVYWHAWRSACQGC